VIKLRSRLFVAGALIVVLCARGLAQANAQDSAVPCYAFEQDALGHWIATTPLAMNSPLGMIDIMPGQRVSVSAAKILNKRCQ
jgi:hypothetical protein